jgi:hypothetical protein
VKPPSPESTDFAGILPRQTSGVLGVRSTGCQSQELLCAIVWAPRLRVPRSLNETSDGFVILIHIAAHGHQRSIQHCFGSQMSGPRIRHLDVKLPQRPHLPLSTGTKRHERIQLNQAAVPLFGQSKSACLPASVIFTWLMGIVLPPARIVVLTATA